MSGLTDVLYLINNVDMYDARRGERLGENGCELSELKRYHSRFERKV